MEKNRPPARLWTRDFTIITWGSFVSMMGNSIVSFAMSLLVLDYTQSTLLYSVYMFLYTVPQVLSPIISGPLLDRFSRRKAIYTLDFITAALYGGFALFLGTGNFSFPLLAGGCLLIGIINSVYLVAYDSLYPLLISKGNFTKAYSIASTLQTLTNVMIPVSALLYNSIGMVAVFGISAGAFLIAAIAETRVVAPEEARYMRISREGDAANAVEAVSNSEAGKGEAAELDEETLKRLRNKSYSGSSYIKDLKAGFSYLLAEKGLLAIAVYFMFQYFAGGITQVLTLPYFKGNFTNGEYTYIYVWGFMVLGRVLGGSLHYRLRFPVEKKYYIALGVYIIISLLEGSYLYFPIAAMCVMCFFTGIFGVTSYNIRISSTQSYVPDEKKGRFNGIFLMLTTTGTLLGQLVAGALSSLVDTKIIFSCVFGTLIIAAFIIISGNREHVKKIYNRNA